MTQYFCPSSMLLMCTAIVYDNKMISCEQQQFFKVSFDPLLLLKKLKTTTPSSCSPQPKSSTHSNLFCIVPFPLWPCYAERRDQILIKNAFSSLEIMLRNSHEDVALLVEALISKSNMQHRLFLDSTDFLHRTGLQPKPKWEKDTLMH